jgi:hypothetical protein
MDNCLMITRTFLLMLVDLSKSRLDGKEYAVVSSRETKEVAELIENPQGRRWKDSELLFERTRL